ncbi:MAG: carbohydrate ABC transporter permease [Phycisphaerales bacterium]
MTQSHASPLRSWLLTAMVAICALLFIAPLVWMFATSLKPETQAASASLSALPDPPSSALQHARDNYSSVWNDQTIKFPLYLRNTLIVAVLGVAGMTLSSAVVAYGLSRVRWRGSALVFGTILVTMMIPFPVIMVPMYLVFRELGWIGTLKPLWVPAWFGGAFSIFLLRQFFMGIPKDLDEAARIDGMNHWSIFWRVIVPLSKPALAVVALFHFIAVWNDFLAPMLFLTKTEQFTLALGLQMYQSKAGLTPWNLLMAASTLVVLPVIVLFVLAQRSLVRGIAAEGLKE